MVSEEKIRAIRERWHAASQELYKLHNGQAKICIPAQDDDTDVVINSALEDIQPLIQENLALERRIKELELENLELQDALSPFAVCADWFHGYARDDLSLYDLVNTVRWGKVHPIHRIRVKHIRRANAILSNKP